MAEETEELPVAYRQLRRGDDGRMRVMYIDEDGNVIDYNDLDNYNVNEVTGATGLPEGDEEAPAPAPAAPQQPSAPSYRAAPQQDDPTSREEWMERDQRLRDLTGNYEGGPDFMFDLQEKIGNFLGGSKLIRGMDKIASGAEKLGEWTGDFMKDEVQRREVLKDAGITTAEDVKSTYISMDERTAPYRMTGGRGEYSPEFQTPVQESLGTGYTPSMYRPMDQMTQDARNPAAAPDVRVVPTTTIPVDPVTQAILSGTPGPNGGLPTEIQEQLDTGVQLGQASADYVVQQQLRKQEEMRARNIDPVAAEMQGLQNMGQGFNLTPADISRGGQAQSTGGSNRHTQGLTPEKLDVISEVADELGVSTSELAGIIGTETADTFDPTKTNSYGYQGLIQFGEPERNKYVSPYGSIEDLSFEEQLKGPVVDYLRDRGYENGMGAEALYRTIHAGNPGASPTATDFATSKTTRDTFYDWVAPRINSAESYINALTQTAVPGQRPVSYDVYAPTTYDNWGTGTTSPWDGFTGGSLSSDSNLGGFAFPQASSPTSVANQNLGFYSPAPPLMPIDARDARAVPTTTFTSQVSGPNLSGGFGGLSTTGFTRQDQGQGSQSYSSPSSYSGSGVSSAGRSNPSSGGTTASRQATTSGYQQYAASRSQQDQGQGSGGSNGGGGASQSTGGGGGTSSQQSTSSPSQQSYSSNQSISDWNDNNSWF